MVREIMEATLEELAQVGFGGMRIERIAATAGVNKTTIYRRWPTKEDLVKSTLMEAKGRKICAADTGSLRGDLRAMAMDFCEFASSVRGQTLVRTIFAEGIVDSGIREILRSIRAEYRHIPMGIFRRAVERKECSADIDPEVVMQALFGTLHHRAFFHGEAIDERVIDQLVDLLLFGANPPTARRAR